MASSLKNERVVMSRMFSSAVFAELAGFGRSSLFRRLFEQSGLPSKVSANTTVGAVFDLAFSHLKRSGSRHEYIYRSAVTSKVLVGRHSLRTASMLSEFRAGTSRADLVILNGSSTVYEIKSERDSLNRIHDQVRSYSEVFASINVVTSERHLEKLRESLPEEVGILILSDRFQLTEVRRALATTEHVRPEAILDCLRTSEAISVLRSLGIEVPNVPNTRRREMLKGLFSELTPELAHRQMVETLKTERSLAPLQDLVSIVPESMLAAVLSRSTNRTARVRLLQALETSVEALGSWR